MEKETLYRYVACQASPEEETAVLTWLEADPAHESELAKVQRQHDLVALSAPVINELYAKDRRRPFRLRPAPVERGGSGRRTARLRRLLFSRRTRFLAAGRTATVGIRTLRTARQPDVAGRHFGMAQRRNDAALSGALYGARAPCGDRRRSRFEVVHDAKHPFIVRTYACDVEVLGTKFNVVAEEENGLFSTALFEGRVAVSSRLVPGERLVLEPDEMVTLEGKHLCLAQIDNDEEYLWTNGIISLTDQSFSELMHRFEKTFGVTIRIEREPSIRIGQGKIRQSVGIDNALQVLQRFADFEYEKDEQNNTITIR